MNGPTSQPISPACNRCRSSARFRMGRGRLGTVNGSEQAGRRNVDPERPVSTSPHKSGGCLLFRRALGAERRPAAAGHSENSVEGCSDSGPQTGSILSSATSNGWPSRIAPFDEKKRVCVDLVPLSAPRRTRNLRREGREPKDFWRVHQRFHYRSCLFDVGMWNAFPKDCAAPRTAAGQIGASQSSI